MDEARGPLETSEVIHIAGLVIETGPYLRQRCAWCGAILVDCDLRRIAVPEGQDPKPATWEVGGLVARTEGVSWVIPHRQGVDKLPEKACAKLDPAVTA